MNVSFCRLVSSVACSAIILGYSAFAFGAVLTWEGDVGTGWFDNVGGNTNWSGNQLPQDGDAVIFLGPSTGAIYGGTLNLGGATIALNSITVGAPNDTAAGGPSDFGVTLRELGSNGTVRLGSGGLTANMAYSSLVYPAGPTRNVRFGADFELSADTFFKTTLPTGKWNYRQLLLGGDVRNAPSTGPINLEMSTPDGGSGNLFAIVYERGMPDFVGTLSLSGTNSFSAATDIWGAPSSTVKLSYGGSTNLYAHKTYGGDVVTPNDLELSPSRAVLLFAYGSPSKWTFTGDISGGSGSAALDLLAQPGATFVFAGENQTFANRVDVRSGASVIIAGADSTGIAWPNVNSVRLNWSLLYNAGTSLKIRGNYTLGKNIQVINQGVNYSVVIGEVNDGATAFGAVFTGNIDCQDPDVLSPQLLQLTADAGGSATFNGMIRVSGGAAGFDKVGAGTVVVNNRVSENFTNTNPIGPVNVRQGTLLVNSPGGNDSFYTSGIGVAAGATLGGSGTIVGDVTLAGPTAELRPGASVGTLTVNGDVDFSAGGRFEVQIDGNQASRLDVAGLLNLSSLNDELLLDLIGPAPTATLIIASYGSLLGDFQTDNVSSLPPGFWLDYNYLGLNQIALVVPEPSSLVLLLAGLACLAWRIRR